MNQIKTCKYCDTTFEDIHPNVFANHVRWCTKNTSNGDKGSSKIQSALEKAFNKKLGEFREFEVLCKKCERNFLVKEREKLHPTREVYYCSKRCSKSRIISDEMKENIKKKLLKTEIRSCIFCKKQFSITKKVNRSFVQKGVLTKIDLKNLTKNPISITSPKRIFSST